MATRSTNASAASWKASDTNRRNATQQLIVFPHGEVATRDILRSKLCTQADSKKQCCENLARKLSFDDFGVPNTSGNPAALTLFDTEIRSDVKLLAFFKPDPMLGLQPNAWAKAVLPGVLRAKITIFGPVLVVILHSIGKEQSLLPLEGGPQNLISLLTAKRLPRPNHVATASAIIVPTVKRINSGGSSQNEDYGAAAARRPMWFPRDSALPGAALDLDMKKDVDECERLIIPSHEDLNQVIEEAESKLLPYRRCTTLADEERYDLGGQVESRMKTVICKHFCDDEVCNHVRPPARRVFSGHAEGCSFSHHPSRFQQVPNWCLDDPGFICWCLKHLPPERQVVQWILNRLIDQFERLQDCPICFIKHPPVALHREGEPAQLTHVACANCTKQILDQECPACPVCRKEIPQAECRSILESIKHDGWAAWRDVASEVYRQLSGSQQDKEPVLGSNWDTDSDFAEQQESLETTVEEQADIHKEDFFQNFEESRDQRQKDVNDQPISFEQEEEAFRGSGEDLIPNQDPRETLRENPALSAWENTPPPPPARPDTNSIKVAADPYREQDDMKRGMQMNHQDLIGSCGDLGTATCQASQQGAALSETLSTSASEVYSTAPSADFGMPSLSNPTQQAISTNGHGLLPPVGAPPPPPRGPPPNLRPPPAACLAVRAQGDSFFSTGAVGSSLGFPPPQTSSSMASVDRPAASTGSVADVDSQEFLPSHECENKKEMQAEFREWLQDHRLGEYEAPLREKGADRLEIMKYVLDADLQNLGMPLLHRRALLNISDSSQIASWRASRNLSPI